MNCALCLSNYRLMAILLLAGITIGFILGGILIYVREEYTTREAVYISFLGDIFLQILKCIAVPLTVAYLVSSIGSLDIMISRRITWQVAVLILLTKIQSILMAIILTINIRPGKTGERVKENETFVEIDSKDITSVDTILDLVRNAFPSNVIGMFFYVYETVLEEPVNGTDDKYTWDIKNGQWKDNVNMLGVVSCSIILGLTLALIQSDGKYLLDIFTCLAQAVMKITIWVLWISPILVIFLIAGQIVKLRNIKVLLSRVGLYVAVVCLCYAIQAVIVYPLMYFLLVCKNPFKLMSHYKTALVTAFATASSLATMPVSIQCLGEANLDKRLIHFMIPVLHGVNKDGGAIFQGCASIFITQLLDRFLSFVNLLTIFILSIAASFAAAGIPYSSTVCLVMVLDGTRLPTTDIGMILAVDFLVDRLGTVINVMGDCYIVGILNHYNKLYLEESSLDKFIE